MAGSAAQPPKHCFAAVFLLSLAVASYLVASQAETEVASCRGSLRIQQRLEPLGLGAVVWTCVRDQCLPSCALSREEHVHFVMA